MSSENNSGITGLDGEKRWVQARENRIRLLAENGGTLIELYQKVFNQVNRREVRGSFFVSVWPEIRLKDQGFEQDYRHLRFVEDYRDYFPWVEAGLVFTNSVNRITIILGRLPVVNKLINGDREEIIADYPLVITSPNREALAPVWDKKNNNRFYKVFDNRAFDGQYSEATVVDGKQMDLLMPCLIEMAVGTLSNKDVVWSERDVNAYQYDIKTWNNPRSTIFQNLPIEQFKQLVLAAKSAGLFK